MAEYYARNKNSPDIWKKPALITKLKVHAFSHLPAHGKIGAGAVMCTFKILKKMF